jgi:hypothetical protein
MLNRFISSVWNDVKSGLINVLVGAGILTSFILITVFAGFLVSYIPFSFFKEMMEVAAKKNDMFGCYMAFGTLAWLTSLLLLATYGVFYYFKKKWQESKLTP